MVMSGDIGTFTKMQIGHWWCTLGTYDAYQSVQPSFQRCFCWILVCLPFISLFPLRFYAFALERPMLLLHSSLQLHNSVGFWELYFTDILKFWSSPRYSCCAYPLFGELNLHITVSFYPLERSIRFEINNGIPSYCGPNTVWWTFKYDGREDYFSLLQEPHLCNWSFGKQSMPSTAIRAP